MKNHKLGLLEKNDIKNLLRGNFRIDLAKTIISHPLVAQNTRNFLFCFFGGVYTLGSNFGKFFWQNRPVGWKLSTWKTNLSHPEITQNVDIFGSKINSWYQTPLRFIFLKSNSDIMTRGLSGYKNLNIPITHAIVAQSAWENFSDVLIAYLIPQKSFIDKL